MSYYIKRIVCLANSTKKGGKCVAGREIENDEYGEWIRPVGDRPSGAVLPEEYKYQDGGFCRLLDVIDIPLLRAEPRQHQTENHVIDAGYYWAKKNTASWQELAGLVQFPSSLWLNGSHTQPGLNDCIPEADASDLTSSLLFIAPEEFSVHVGIERPGSQWAKQGVRAEFKYGRTDYSLRITDPALDRLFRSKGDGDYKLNDVYVCVSLTEPFDDHRCHKLVAAIFSERPLR